MRTWHRRWNLLRLVALVWGCGGSESSGVPDAGGGGNLLAVSGSYPTTVTLLPGGTCSGVVVQNAVTTVTHAPGAAALTLRHAGTSYPGTVDTAGNFQTGPEEVVAGAARYVISIAGRFTTTGLDATATVQQTVPTSCTYSVGWVGAKSGSPNVIPG